MIWRLLFLGVYILFFFIRSPYSSNNNRFFDNNVRYEFLKSQKKAREREGTLSMTVRSILSFLMLLGIIVYTIYPSWLIIFSLPIPNWLRLTALVSVLLTLPLLQWAHHALGSQYSPDLELQKEHRLITTGPYKIVRHPMYTILIIFMLSISLFSANYLILIPHILAIFLILFRLSKEEAMLIQEFGDDYCEYIAKTGRLLPKLN